MHSTYSIHRPPGEKLETVSLAAGKLDGRQTLRFCYATLRTRLGATEIAVYVGAREHQSEIGR